MAHIEWISDPKVWGIVRSADNRFTIISGGNIVTLHDQQQAWQDTPGSVANAKRIAEGRV